MRLQSVDLVREALALIRRNAGLLFGLAAFPVFAASAFGSLVERSSTGDGLAYLVAMLVHLAASSAATVLVTRAAMARAAGRDLHAGELTAALGQVTARVLVVGVATTVATTLGLFLMIVPGLVLSAIWFVALPAVILEDRGPVGALRRSAELTLGHRWQVFGTFGLAALVAGAGGILASMAGELIQEILDGWWLVPAGLLDDLAGIMMAVVAIVVGGTVQPLCWQRLLALQLPQPVMPARI